MLGRDQRQALLIETYWSALGDDRAAAPPEQLDPRVADTLLQLHSASQRLQPDAKAIELRRRRLESQLRSSTVAQPAWSGPAVDPAQQRQAAQALKDAQERVLQSGVAQANAEALRALRRRWFTEGLGVAAAVAVFVLVALLLVLVIGDDQQPQTSAPGPTTTVVTSPTAEGRFSRTPTASSLDLTVTTVWSNATAEARGTATAFAQLPIGSDLGPVTAAIATGLYPMDMELAFGSIWVANGTDHTVTRIDITTNQVVATIDVGTATRGDARSPDALIILDDQLWVSIPSDGSLARIDPATNAVVQTITLPNDAPWHWSGHAAGAGSLWLSDSDNNQVIRIDPASGSVVATIPVERTGELLVTGEAVWVANYDQTGSRILRIDPATNEVVDVVPIGSKSGPMRLTLGFGSLWVAHQFSGVVHRIDPATGTIVATVSEFHIESEGVALSPHALAVDEQGVWVGDRLRGGLYLIDPTTNQVQALTMTASISDILAAGGSIWVSLQSADMVARIDPTR